MITFFGISVFEAKKSKWGNISSKNIESLCFSKFFVVVFFLCKSIFRDQKVENLAFVNKTNAIIDDVVVVNLQIFDFLIMKYRFTEKNPYDEKL